MGYIDYLREYANKFNQNFSDLEDVLEELKEAADGFKTINEFLIHIENVKNEIEKNKVVQDGVILSTIHGVKGMEFKNVFIINCNEETIPHKSSIEDNLEEERRLFYVAITRAIKNLYIFSPKTIRGKFNDVSRFITESGVDSESQIIDYGVKVNDNVYHRVYGDGIIKNIKDDRVSINFKDIKRTFSLRILMEDNLIRQGSIMKNIKNIIKIFLLAIMIVFNINFKVYSTVYSSPKEGEKLERFIEKNNDLLSSEEKSNLNDIASKLNKYNKLSQEEREYIRECQLSIIRKNLGDSQFDEYKKLIEKRSSGVEFEQNERFRLYELEKLLR